VYKRWNSGGRDIPWRFKVTDSGGVVGMNRVE